VTENEVNDDPPPNRFSAVIEKIERLYTVCYT
jgi:ubinuclein